jgi:hypothetical protein
VGPRAGVDDVEKRKFLSIPGPELRPLDRLARSQSLYRLRYPGSPTVSRILRKIIKALRAVGVTTRIRSKYLPTKTLILNVPDDSVLQ